MNMSKLVRSIAVSLIFGVASAIPVASFPSLVQAQTTKPTTTASPSGTTGTTKKPTTGKKKPTNKPATGAGSSGSGTGTGTGSGTRR